MKKLGVLFIALLLIGCADKKQDMNVADPTALRTILKIQEDLSEKNEFNYQLIDIKSNSEMEYFPYAQHFDQEKIKEGYILEPEDSLVNAELIIVVEVADSDLLDEVADNMDKLTSDQMVRWTEYIESQKQLVKTNRIEQQGNYILYVTSKNANHVVQIFQEQVR